MTAKTAGAEAVGGGIRAPVAPVTLSDGTLGGAEDLGAPRPGPTTARATLVVWAALALGAAAMVAALRSVALPFALAALLSYLIGPAVERLHRWGLSRGLSIVSVYLVVAATAAAFVIFVLPDLVSELQRVSGALPGLTAGLQAHIADLRAGYRRLPLPASLRGAADTALAKAQRGAEAAVRQTMADLLGGFGLIVQIALAPILTYYLLSDLPRIRTGFARLLPPAARQPVLACLSDLDAVVAGFVRGEFLTSAAVGVLAGLAALLLGLRIPFTLGLVAAVGELIPYVGPVIGAVPALAVAGAQGGLPLALETAAAYLAIQQIESMVLAPRIMGASVGLHPLVTIAALLAGERLGGLAGMVVSVPIAACARVAGSHLVRALTALRAPRRVS